MTQDLPEDLASHCLWSIYNIHCGGLFCSWCYTCSERWCVLVTYLLLWENTQQKQLKEGRAYFGSQFEVTVLHDRENMVAEIWGSEEAEWWTPASDQLVFSFLFSSRLQLCPHSGCSSVSYPSLESSLLSVIQSSISLTDMLRGLSEWFSGLSKLIINTSHHITYFCLLLSH